MTARLSALRAGRNFTPRFLCVCVFFLFFFLGFLVLISVKRLSRPQGHIAAGRIRQIRKKSPSSGPEPATSGLQNSALTTICYRVPQISSKESAIKRRIGHVVDKACLNKQRNNKDLMWIVPPQGFKLKMLSNSDMQLPESDASFRPWCV
jgi:hypothetical protein